MVVMGVVVLVVVVMVVVVEVVVVMVMVMVMVVMEVLVVDLKRAMTYTINTTTVSGMLDHIPEFKTQTNKHRLSRSYCLVLSRHPTKTHRMDSLEQAQRELAKAGKLLDSSSRTVSDKGRM